MDVEVFIECLFTGIFCMIFGIIAGFEIRDAMKKRDKHRF